MSGFISIERDIWDHPLFANGEMTEREAFMWMIARAAWADTRHKVGSELVEVKRGSFVTTLRELQSVFMWKSDKRVRTFLKSLENNDMIGRTTVGTANAPKTHVTVCNYDLYQSVGRTKDAPRTHGGRTTDAVKEQDNKITTTPEANASGRDAASEPEGEDLTKQLFDRAVAFLGRHGVKDQQARSFVGKLRKDGHTDGAIFDAFARCARAGPVQPIPWITKALGASKAHEPPITENVVRLAMQHIEAREQARAAR